MTLGVGVFTIAWLVKWRTYFERGAGTVVHRFMPMLCGIKVQGAEQRLLRER
jgi:hypothetical protein